MNTYLEIEFKDEVLKGFLLKEDEEYLVLKLSSGYNANLKKSDIKILSQKEEEIKKKSSSLVKQNDPTLKNILILHTGGTIASKVDYQTGGVSSKFTPEELLTLYPELDQLANISARMIGNLFSEDMRFSHYNLMLNELKQANLDGFDGVIISHGTDTLHYTSSALSYATKNLPFPVILVGAQRSSDRASSDAFSNLKAAVEFIVSTTPQFSYLRVGACMHSSISDDEFLLLDGINLKKMHSSRRDAFKQINYSPVARISVSGEITTLRKDLFSSVPKNEFSITLYDESLKIGFFKAHPNVFPEEISALSIYDGVVIEGTGLGHLAINQVDESTKLHLKNFEELKKLSKTTRLVLGVQTISGQVHMDVYSTGRMLQQAQILGNHSTLITETLFSRLAYCLSQKELPFLECWKKNLEGFDQISLDNQ